MRSLSGRTQTYLDALRRHGIPASCGSDDLFAAEEIRFLFALLQIIDNPHQDIPLLTVLLSPFGGYPADELARLRAGDRDADLYTLLCESKAPICAVLEDLRRTAPGSAASHPARGGGGAAPAARALRRSAERPAAAAESGCAPVDRGFL